MDKKRCLGTRKIQNAAVITGFTENRIENRILFKGLLPDDENDPTGRGIRFSKKAGI